MSHETRPVTRRGAGTTSSFDSTLQGRLGDAALAEAIRQAYINQKTGILHLERQGLGKRVYFNDGGIVFANSDSDSDRIGQFLIRAGAINESVFTLASKVMQETGRRFGRTVVELGVMSEQTMTGLVKDQIQEIIYSLFDWDSGQYGFEQIERPVEDDIVLELSTTDILLAAIRRTRDRVDIDEVFGDRNRILRYNHSPLPLNAKMSFSSEEGFMLSRVDGASTISEILAVSPLNEEKTLRCIYGLILSGVVEIGEEAEPTSAVSKLREEELSKPQAKPESETEESESEKKEKADGFTEEEKALVENITQKHASLGNATLYDVLEVSPGASDSDIKKAYYSLAKRFHPDRHHFRQLPAVRRPLEQLFLEITRAHDVLSNPGRRRRYDGKLQLSQEKGGDNTAPGAIQSRQTPTSDPKKSKSPEDMADSWYQQGKRHYYGTSYFEAVQCLREAVRLDPEKTSYHKLLARALMRNRKWRKEAESHFRQALEKNQFDIECYLGLAALYEDSLMTSKAMKMYQIVLGYDPTNKVARQKVLGKDKKTGKGLIKRIVGPKRS